MLMKDFSEIPGSQETNSDQLSCLLSLAVCSVCMLFVWVHTNIHLYIWLCGHMYMHACGGQRSMLDVRYLSIPFHLII